MTKPDISKLVDKNGVEWVEGKHKESIVNGVKCPTEVVEAFGKELLIRSSNKYGMSMWNEEQIVRLVEFVETRETVDDIRADVKGTSLMDYANENGIQLHPNNYAFETIATHLIYRVVKAMEAEHE